MLIFPQLSTGASVQYPIRRRLSQRSVRSTLGDGTIIALADPAAAYLRWQIEFKDLSDQEVRSLKDFFNATHGSLMPFVFLDPATNLLLWSEDYTRGSWLTTGITFDRNVTDPMGTTRAVRVRNGGSARAAISQDTQIPGSAQVCFSAYLRADISTTASLTRTAGSQTQSIEAPVTNIWRRFCLSGGLSGVTEPSRFAINVPAGASFELFGPQIDAQVSPSQYVVSTGSAGGIHTDARFDMKELDVIATGPNRSSCVVCIRCNLPAGE